MREDVLLIDAYNLFIRCYTAVPSIGANGEPNGATFGFLKSLQKLMKKFDPKWIFIVWDGEGGSKKRRSIFEGYKEGRKPVKLNRNVDQEFSVSEENENKLKQFVRLIEYLNFLPVIQILIENTEADDIIGRLSRAKQLTTKKIIVSSDKDFLQLVKDDVLLYRPIEDKMYQVQDVIDEFQIHPKNFALAKALAGDKSDNIDGIPGVGLKSVAKRFPQFVSETSISLDDLIEHCKTIEKPLQIHRSLQENVPLVQRNVQLMDLSIPRLSPGNSRKINEMMDNFQPTFNKMEIIKMLITDGISSYNWQELFLQSSFVVKSF